MDTKVIKSKFPIFKDKINGKPLTYLDNANSSQKPQSVIDRISKFLLIVVFDLIYGPSNKNK